MNILLVLNNQVSKTCYSVISMTYILGVLSRITSVKTQYSRLLSLTVSYACDFSALRIDRDILRTHHEYG